MWSSLFNLVSQLMGNQFGQFCHALKQGQCLKANEMYFNSKKLREAILSRVNEPLGPEHDNNSVLHYVAQYKMQNMYEDLLNSDKCPGVPDLKNSRRRNCFHLICLNGTDSHAALNMLRFTVEFLRKQKVDVTHLLAEKDEDGNTALHLAAAVGLIDCVDLLVSHNADMYATNTKEETAADIATHTNHKEIATKLETQMVFSNDPGELVTDTDPTLLQELAEQPTGMQDTDLRSMKDQLLIETSEMLGVSLFTAEALLRNHGWSKEELLEAWMRSPDDVCEKAGVQLPSSLGVHNLLDDGLGERGQVSSVDPGSEWECGICCVPSAVEVQVPCEHHFCKDCWKEYLEGKIKAGEAHNILCPEYGCYKLVPLDVIENVVSREMAQRFLNFDIKAFVDSNPNIRWCTHPGCGQAVALATPTEDPFELLQMDGLTGSRGRQRNGRVAHCGKHHYFCWDCMGEAHEPCSCEEWKKWLELIEEMKPKVGGKTSAESNEAASFRWLASRSKPCPKCKAPIEKTEGCNHMCCKKCKHDFCWVCLDNWGCHNSSTGGYFECNRYDAQKKAQELLVERKDKINEEYAEIEKMGKFLHYFERYKGHGQSLELEVPFLDKAHHKMALLAASVQFLEQSGGASMPRNRTSSSATLGTRMSTEFMSFIEEAVQELLKDRRVLRASYGFGYFIYSKVAQRQFENMQGALEQVTEYLAEVVARPHLRKPRQEIIRLTREAREKRHHLIRQVHIGLPDLTPPMLPPRRATLPSFMGGVMDDDPSPPPSHHGFDLIRLWQGERDRRSPSPSPPVTRPSLFGGSRDRDRRSLPSRSRLNRNRPREEDRGLRHILEMSRMEYEADQQLNKDLEMAKALSMQERPPSPTGSYEEIGDRDSQDSLTPLHSVSSWLNIPSESGEATNWVDQSYPRRNLSSPPPSWPTWNLERRTVRDDATHMDLLLPPRTIPRSSLPPLNYPPNSPTPNGDPVGLLSPLPLQPAPVSSPSPEHLSPTSPEHFSVTSLKHVSPTSPEVMDANTSPVGSSEWGPLYGEDEDLKRAIQMSLTDVRENSADHERRQVDQSGLSINGPQFLDYNVTFDNVTGTSSDRVDVRSDHDITHEITLPPELRHLLATSSRTGAHV